jgi:hypothetical protein
LGEAVVKAFDPTRHNEEKPEINAVGGPPKDHSLIREGSMNLLTKA